MRVEQYADAVPLWLATRRVPGIMASESRDALGSGGFSNRYMYKGAKGMIEVTRKRQEHVWKVRPLIMPGASK